MVCLAYKESKVLQEKLEFKARLESKDLLDSLVRKELAGIQETKGFKELKVLRVLLVLWVFKAQLVQAFKALQALMGRRAQLVSRVSKGFKVYREQMVQLVFKD